MEVKNLQKKYLHKIFLVITGIVLQIWKIVLCQKFFGFHDIAQNQNQTEYFENHFYNLLSSDEMFASQDFTSKFQLLSSFAFLFFLPPVTL